MTLTLIGPQVGLIFSDFHRSAGETPLFHSRFEDGAAPAPMLGRVAMAPEEAQLCLRRIIDNVALWLTNHRVQGDLSPYTILYRGGEVVLIDFPQAVDPRFNENARSLLERELENSVRAFRAHGAAGRSAANRARALAALSLRRFVTPNFRGCGCGFAERAGRA